VNLYTLQHVHQVGVRVNAVQPLRQDNALHDVCVLSAIFGSAK
jgi:hypothetical protein